MQEESTLTNAQPKTQVTRVTKSDMGRLGIALFGGILVLNYYLARLFFTGAIDGFAMKLSALIGAIILSLPIYWEAVKDLCHGKVGMNELVALALLAAFACGIIAGFATGILHTVLGIPDILGKFHHDKFVQVARRDREKLETLKERVGGVSRLLQHALVE